MDADIDSPSIEKLSGVLLHKGAWQYAGFRVRAVYRERFPGEGPATDGKAGGSGNGSTPSSLEELSFPASRVADVAVGGEFALELPARNLRSGPVTLQVVAPDGGVIDEETLKRGNFEAPLELEVDDVPRPSTPATGEPERAQRRVLAGQLVDELGRRPAADLQVVLWGKPKGAGVHERALLVARTDRNGYFSGEYPLGLWESGRAMVGIGDGVECPIELVAEDPFGTTPDGADDSSSSLPRERFPRSILLVVDLGEKEAAGSTEDQCHCGDDVKRDPDAIDLVTSPGVYSTDLGPGQQCISFATPNRTFEEVTYYSLVRTTDPEIVLGAAPKMLAVPPTLPPEDTPGTPPPGVPAGQGEAIQVSESETTVDETGGRQEEQLKEDALGTGLFEEGKESRSRESSVETAPAVAAESVIEPGVVATKTVQSPQHAAALERVRQALTALARPAAGRAELTEANAIDWDDEPTLFQATTIAHGHLLSFKQRWVADGYSLGDLLYSLPLAPGQKKQIAVVDWDRREAASRAEEARVDEFLAASLSRNRDIAEIASANVSESLYGRSVAEAGYFAAGFGGGGSMTTQGGASFGAVVGVAGGHSSAGSEAWQSSARDTSAFGLQQLHDLTQQSAAAVRNQRTTVVQAVSQGEAVRVETDVVANHNHCHALTIQYFEVLRHFLVREELVNVRECVFVPLVMRHFDGAKALRWQQPLRRYLRDGSLDPGFAALERVGSNWTGSNLPTGRYVDEIVEDLEGELRVRMRIVRPPDPGEGESAAQVAGWARVALLLAGQPQDLFERVRAAATAQRDAVFQSQIAPRVAEEWVKGLKVTLKLRDNREVHPATDATLLTSYSPDGWHYVRVRFDSLTAPGEPQYTRDQIEEVSLQADQARQLPGTSKAVVENLALRYRTAHLDHILAAQQLLQDDLTSADPVTLRTPPDQRELRNPREEDQELARTLVHHLNEHLEHYHQAIWWSMDANRRYMLLDGYLAPPKAGARRRSLASVVDNRLLAVVGNSLVFPVSPGFQLDPTYQPDPANPTTLLEHYAPPTPMEPSRITVPTRGVFAEAVTGYCNSCEQKDDTRFWRWDEVPSTDEPTAIAPVSAESRRAEPGSLQARDFPAPIVAMQTAPSAPDPGGVAAALQLLGRPDLFRDVTGLAGNQAAALAGLQTGAAAAQAFGSQAASLTGEAAKLAQQERLGQTIQPALQEIDRAERAGRITKDQAADLTVSALRGLIGDDRKPKEPLSETPAIKDAIGAAQKQENFQVAAQQPSGEQVSVSARPPRTPRKPSPSKAADPARPEAPSGPTETEIIDKYTSLNFLDEAGLARELFTRLPGESGLVERVLDALSSTDRDDVALEIARDAPQDRLGTIWADPLGRAVLIRLVRELKEGVTTNDEAAAMERLVRLASPAHRRLRSEPWTSTQAVASALANAGTKLQSIAAGSADVIYDEYSIKIQKMPPGLTPEQYLAEMAVDLNRAINDQDFNGINIFKRVPSTPTPSLGDLYDIDIAGPDNGTVMLVERGSNYFIFQTVARPLSETGTHPEFGSREFGFERQPDGTVMFYTRGASRVSWLTNLLPEASAIPQKLGWTALARGIGNELQRRGGQQLAGSFTSWSTVRTL